jgi:hypothetical protein
MQWSVQDHRTLSLAKHALRPTLPSPSGCALEPPAEERQPAERRPEVSNQGEADASPPLPWWQEMLKSTLPPAITPLVTAAVTGFGSILAASEAAIILAAVSFSMAVIAAVVGVYFGIKRRHTAGFSGHEPHRMLRICGLDVGPA